MITKAGNVNRMPVTWSLNACCLKAPRLFVEMSSLLDSIAPQKLSIYRMFRTAKASILFYLIFPQQNPPLGFWFRMSLFYLKNGQNPNIDPGKLSLINKNPKSSSITIPSQFLATLLSSNWR